MKILVPTNLDPAESNYFSSATDEIVFYGRNSRDEVGSVFDLFVRNEIRESFAAIKKFTANAARLSRKFFYLMDAVCLDNTEIDRRYHFKIVELIERLADAGAAGVIVSSPMLLQIVKAKRPELLTIVSPGLKLESYQSVEAMKRLGASGVVFSPSMTRDGKFLAMADSDFSGEYDFVYINSGCYVKSIFCVRHLAEMSHFSQNFIDHKMCPVDLGGLMCLLDKNEKPERFITTPFLTPARAAEYRRLYPRLNFMVSDSDGTFASVRHVFDTYFRNKRTDNIFTAVKNCYFLRDLNAKTLKLKPEDAELIFAGGLAEKSSCAYKDCAKCGLCAEFYRKYVSYDEAERQKIIRELRDIEASCSV